MYLSDLNDLYEKIDQQVQQVCHQHPLKCFIIVPNFGSLPFKFRQKDAPSFAYCILLVIRNSFNWELMQRAQGTTLSFLLL